VMTGKRCEIGCKLVLFTDRKSHTGFRRCVNLSRRQHLRNALFDVLHRQSGTHYWNLFSIMTLLQYLRLG